MELKIASSDITLQLLALLEAHVDAWNFQATIVTLTLPFSLARVLKVGVCPRHAAKALLAGPHMLPKVIG